MKIEIDQDVEAVAGFMTENIPAARLVAIANALAALAPSLWGKYEPESVDALRLVWASPSSERTRSTSSEFGASQ